MDDPGCALGDDVISKQVLSIETPRVYQEFIFERAKERNTIAVLPTGAGKTLIAVLLLKHMHSVSPTGQISVFVVPTIPLVSQQAAYIQKNSELKVSHYWGGMNGSKTPNPEEWSQFVLHSDVIVLTSGILRCAVEMGALKFAQVQWIHVD